MKYKALRRRKQKEVKDKLETDIDTIQNSSREEDIKKLEVLKEEL